MDTQIRNANLISKPQTTSESISLDDSEEQIINVNNDKVDSPGGIICKYVDPIEQILSELDPASISDIFRAYDLPCSSISMNQVNIYLTEFQRKKTFNHLLDVIISNRSAYTIMKHSNKIGMYIPLKFRHGIKAYEYYLDNIRYYELTFSRCDQLAPSLIDIYLSKDRVNLCLKFRDNEILKPGYIFDRNYDSRLSMIQNFIEQNINIYGQFYLKSNSRKCYTNKSKSIMYSEPGQRYLYGTQDLLKLVDIKRKIIWKDSKQSFSLLSLHSLRQQILEKFEQWKHRDGYLQFSAPSDLSKILSYLEIILESEKKFHTGSYLGNPQIAVSF